MFLAYTRALFTTVLALRRGRGTGQGHRPSTRETRGVVRVATESEYIGLKASRRSVTYTHLTACTHSSSHERTNNARTSSAREVGHERTAIALPASSHLGDRRVTAHGAFTYAHAPRRRVFAHTRGAVRVRTYLRVRTRRCVLAGNRQTSWLEWGRGGGGNGSTRRRRHDAMPVRRAVRCSRMPRVVPASSCACDVSWPPFSTQPIDCKAVGGHRSTLMLLILVEHCLNFNHPRPLATMKHKRP